MMQEEEKEIKELIEKLYKRMLKESIGARDKKRFKRRIGTNDEHGIYVYRPERGWQLLRIEGEAFRLGELGNGVYVLYFDNTKCPACRIHDIAWYPFVEKHEREAHFVVILCEWFSRHCRSSAAAKSFMSYRIKASPTTIFAYVEENIIVKQVKREGALTVSELEALFEFMKK